jgi:SAM-dependent methyltransferase
VDATEFRRASREVWEAMAAGWDERHAYFEEIARPVTERMLERLEPRPGQTILDIAAGTGVAGFAAAGLVGSEGRVIVSDFARGMVEAASRHATRLGLSNIECRVLDAEALDLPDDAVDGAICRWGYMLMADPAKALAETRRVLRRGGRLACAVFTGPAENTWGALPVGVLVERGHMPPPEAGAPGLFALADRGRLRKLVVEAGFAEADAEEVPFTWRFAGPDDYWRFLQEAAGAVKIVLDQLDPDERSRVGDEVRRRAASFGGSDGIELPGVSLVVSAS